MVAILIGFYVLIAGGFFLVVVYTPPYYGTAGNVFASAVIAIFWPFMLVAFLIKKITGV